MAAAASNPWSPLDSINKGWDPKSAWDDDSGQTQEVQEHPYYNNIPLVRTSSAFELNKTSSNNLIGNFNAWQSFDPDDDRLYVNVSQACTSGMKLPSPPKNTVASVLPPSSSSVYSSGRDNYSMFNDEEWAACGMSLGCPSTRSSVAGYGSTSFADRDAATYESQSTLSGMNSIFNNDNKNTQHRDPIPPSVLAAVLARSSLKDSSNVPSTSQITPPSLFSSTPNPLPSSLSSFPVIPPPPPAVNPVVSQTESLSLTTSLFGCPSLSLNQSNAGESKVVSQRPGFVYADKGPAPQPPVISSTSNQFQSQAAYTSGQFDWNSNSATSAVASESIVSPSVVIPSTASSAEDFMAELESKLTLYKTPGDKNKEEAKGQHQDHQKTSSEVPSGKKSSSWFPTLKPPPSISRNRSFSSSDKKKKQMQVVPPLFQSSSSTAPSGPSAPEREDLYGLLSASTVSRNNDVTQEMESMIDTLTSKVRSASREDCRKCILRHNLDLVSALKDLQVTQLSKLGIGSKHEIESALRSCNWDLEMAASRLLDNKS